MSEFNVRRAATQVERAAFNASCRNWFYGEITAVALIGGFAVKSLAYGLIVWAACLGMNAWSPTRKLLGTVFSLAWGYLAWWVVDACSDHNAVEALAAGAFALAMSAGAHKLAFQSQADFLHNPKE